MAEKYRINEIFYSIQGEGVRAGTANFFLRFTGCNMKCDLAPGPLSPGGFKCDTEFESGRWMDGPEIIGFMRGMSADCDWVICTGGEPGLQLDAALITLLQHHGFKVAVETNGTRNFSGLPLDWITVSPKVAEHAIEQLYANEVKYVRGYGQAIPKTVVEADHYLISPAFDGDRMEERTMRWCMNLVRENPKWRLTCQLHKLWNVR